MFRASGQSDCISRCSTVPFQPVTYSLLQDQMRPGSGSEGKAAGFITPLRQPGSVGSPCVFTCTVAWNACAFHFNLPCHLKPPGAHFEDGKNSIPGLSPVWGLLFSPRPSHLPSQILAQGCDWSHVCLTYSDIAHSRGCATERLGPIAPVPPPRAWMCAFGATWAWLWVPVTHRLLLLLLLTHPPLSIAGGATGRGAERGLWFLSQ